MTDPEIVPDNHDRALVVHRLLMTRYGEPEIKVRRDPLSELVMAILSQNTADVNSHRAWDSLKERFPSWPQVLEASTDELAEAIHIGGLARIKAPRIQHILKEIEADRETLDLSFLDALSVSDARAYLTAFPGVGPKTASCVLLFALHKPALPVDTHVLRVSLRVGLVPPKTTAEKAALILEEALPSTAYYPFHLNVIHHGRTVCKASRPGCDSCALTCVCDYALRPSTDAAGEPSAAN